jgi:hypothetical protein
MQTAWLIAGLTHTLTSTDNRCGLLSAVVTYAHLETWGVGMGGLSEAAIAALDPLVGATAASTCVRATALCLGKTAEDLDGTDLPALEANIKRLLGPIAPDSVIDDVLRQIEGRL